MCTAITMKTHDSYFGRTLDMEFSYDESVCVTPREFPLVFRKHKTLTEHYAMIGMAFVVDGYPLYYDAVNEYGLAMAGLRFPQNAHYYDEDEKKDNITPFEFIPYILSQCTTIDEVKEKLMSINLVNIPFNEKLPLSPLHWIIADKNSSITVETMKDGMKIFDNEVGVLTNNPPFDFMMQNLSDYRALTNKEPENNFSSRLNLPSFSRGLGAVGLPGDFSSASRFVKASFVKLNSETAEDEDESVGQFFHLLGAVEVPKGAVCLGDGVYNITVYTSCMNQDKGVYYYTTYSNRQINAVQMKKENLDSSKLISYALNTKQNINRQN